MPPRHATPPVAGETLELKVDNMSFHLVQLGRDCAPDQLVRELTVNAIQAIDATGEGGRVVWDQDPVLSRRFGAARHSNGRACPQCPEPGREARWSRTRVGTIIGVTWAGRT